MKLLGAMARVFVSSFSIILQDFMSINIDKLIQAKADVFPNLDR